MTTTQKMGPWLGVNNRVQDFALHVDKVGDYLRSAFDVDIDNKGSITRRSAARRIATIAGLHSLHLTSDDAAGYAVVAGALYALTLPDTLTFYRTLSSNAALSWVESGGALFYSNGTDSGRIVAGEWAPLAMATPAKPSCALIGGGLPAGAYQVSVSYSAASTGEESGLSAPARVVLAATGGVRVTLPAAVTGATHINIYATGENGEVLELAAVEPVASAIYDLVARPSGRKGVVGFEAPLPAGELFMSFNRLCSIVNADGKGTVYVGLPWRHGYYQPVRGRLHFNAPVSLAIENEGGTYICAEKTYFYPGDIGNIQGVIHDSLPYGAVRGTAFVHPDTETPRVGWFSAMGIVLADATGQAKAITSESVDVSVPDSGRSVVLQSKGILRVVSCGWCVNLDTAAATQYRGWDFNSISGGYGARSDGLYRLEDVGAVDGAVGFGRLNFGTIGLKYLPAVYVGASSASPLKLAVAYVDEDENDREYDYLPRSWGAGLKQRRFDTGLGLCAAWFDVTLENTDGADFNLASISFSVVDAGRNN